jgi:predicted permease
VSTSRRAPAWRRYLRFWDSNIGADVDDELRFHIEMRVNEYIARGVSPDEARRRVAERFGDVSRAREECVVIDTQFARSEHRMQLLGNLRQDFLFAVRILRHQALAAVAAAFCLALGIGATTAMFSIANTLLLRPLPYPTGDRLVVIGVTREGDQRTDPTSYAAYLDWVERQRSFASLAAVGGTDFTVVRTGAERVRGAVVSASLLTTLGVTPELGRFFLDEEDRLGGPAVIVVSHGFAEREFGDAKNALGQSLMIGGARRQIVGIIPDRTRYPSHADILMPVARDLDSRRVRGNRNLVVLGALRPGVSLDAARHDLALISSALAKLYPETDKGYTTVLTPLREDIVHDARGGLNAMIVAALLVLIVACANVAALQLARAAARTREMAVRAAIGAGRGRLLRQLLTESVLLSFAGGVAGCAFAYASRNFVAGAVMAGTPTWMTFDIDSRTLLFALVVSTLTGILFGVAPALRLAGVSPAATLRGGSAGGGRTRLQHAFVAAQIALSVVLVVGAGLALESVRRLQEIPLGFNPQGVLTFQVVLQGRRYDEPSSHIRLIDAVENSLRALPGVTAVGAASLAPVYGCCSKFSTRIEGDPSEHGRAPMVVGTIITPGYFRAMGIDLLAGREFTSTDGLDAPPVTVINETFAKLYWPNGDALGHHVTAGAGRSEIVGIVRDIKQTSLLEPLEPQFYRPYAEDPWTSMTLAVRTTADPTNLVPAVRRLVRDVDPTIPPFNFVTMQRIVSDATASRRTFGTLLTAFALIALVLAAAGVYAVMSFFVAQRTRELGLRVALGADPSRLAGAVLRQGIAMALAGGAVGLVGAVIAGRALAHALYGMSAGEPRIYAIATLVLIGAAGAASYGPARRASTVDPMIALRTD